MDSSQTGNSARMDAGTRNRALRSAWIACAVAAILLTAMQSARLKSEIRPAPASNQATGAGDATGKDHDAAALLDGFRHVEVASVSDAAEQLLGRRTYLSHRMQPLFPGRFAGYALTVRMEKQENHDPDAVNRMLQAIDHGERDSVYLMSIEDGADIAGMGGLMGTAMAARGFSGAIIDGAVRDTAYLKKIGFPVYATGIAPSTMIGHYRCTGTEIPVVIDGVTVHPGDIVTADSDGVVIVPRERAKDVLRLAEQMDFKEHSMYPLIERARSIEAAVQQFGRL